MSMNKMNENENVTVNNPNAIVADTLEIMELDDLDLDDVAGGYQVNDNCGGNCGCG